jgi:hypothetical protein
VVEPSVDRLSDTNDEGCQPVPVTVTSEAADARLGLTAAVGCSA